MLGLRVKGTLLPFSYLRWPLQVMATDVRTAAGSGETRQEVDEVQQEIREVKRAIVAVQAQVKEKEEELKQAPANERMFVQQMLVSKAKELAALQQQLPPLLQRLTDLTGSTPSSPGSNHASNRQQVGSTVPYTQHLPTRSALCSLLSALRPTAQPPTAHRPPRSRGRVVGPRHSSPDPHGPGAPRVGLAPGCPLLDRGTSMCQEQYASLTGALRVPISRTPGHRSAHATFARPFTASRALLRPFVAQCPASRGFLTLRGDWSRLSLASGSSRPATSQSRITRDSLAGVLPYSLCFPWPLHSPASITTTDSGLVRIDYN